MSALLFAFWFQTDIRSVSWWLPSSPATRDLVWTLVLAANLAVLVWVLYKFLFAGAGWSVPQALRDRASGITSQIQQADAAHQEAAARLAAIEARVANLPAELSALEREGRDEAAREYQRLVEASQRDADHILRQAKLEIEVAAKLAQKELKTLAANLAVDLATRRLRDELSPAQDQVVVQNAIAGMSAHAGKVN